jgi:mRNA (guanine-N7-)-methyltransferase
MDELPEHDKRDLETTQLQRGYGRQSACGGPVALFSFNSLGKLVLLKMSCPRRGLSALDMAGGCGGDFSHWERCGLAYLLLADLTKGRTREARRRYETQRPPFRFEAVFLHADCFGTRFSATLDPAIRFDVVSCQFALHYAFGSEERVRLAMQNVADRLNPGGFFCGTVPNAEMLKQKQKKAVDEKWANSICSLQFEGELEREFGARYIFWMRGAVDHLPEYVVHKEVRRCCCCGKVTKECVGACSGRG